MHIDNSCQDHQYHRIENFDFYYSYDSQNFLKARKEGVHILVAPFYSERDHLFTHLVSEYLRVFIINSKYVRSGVSRKLFESHNDFKQFNAQSLINGEASSLET